MSPAALGYVLFGAGLSAAFAGIIAYYFRAKRRDRVEAPKYRMLEDDTRQ